MKKYISRFYRMTFLLLAISNSTYAADIPREKEPIKLLASDGQVIELPHKIATMSGWVNNLLEQIALGVVELKNIAQTPLPGNITSFDIADLDTIFKNMALAELYDINQKMLIAEGSSDRAFIHEARSLPAYYSLQTIIDRLPEEQKYSLLHIVYNLNIPILQNMAIQSIIAPMFSEKNLRTVLAHILPAIKDSSPETFDELLDNLQRQIPLPIVALPEMAHLVAQYGLMRYFVPYIITQYSTSLEQRRSTHSMAFDPNSTHILTGSYAALLWDITTGEKIQEIEDIHGDGIVRAVAISPDGKFALFAGGSTALVYDLTTNEIVQKLKEESVITSVAFSPDSKQIALGSQNTTASIWDRATGTRIKEFAHNDTVHAVKFSPSGLLLLTGSHDNRATLWHIEAGIQLHYLNHRKPVMSVDFSPDGTFALTGSLDTTAKMWDVERGIELQTLPHPAEVFAVTFDPSGTNILTGCADHVTRIWNIATNSTIQTFLNDNMVLCVAWSPDGTYIASGTEEEERMGSFDTPIRIRSIPPEMREFIHHATLLQAWVIVALLQLRDIPQDKVQLLMKMLPEQVKKALTEILAARQR